MSQIINNTDYTFTPQAQQAIRDAMANCGLDTVYAVKDNYAPGTCFDFYNVSDGYEFSADIEGDENGKPVIYQK